MVTSSERFLSEAHIDREVQTMKRDKPDPRTNVQARCHVNGLAGLLDSSTGLSKKLQKPPITPSV